MNKNELERILITPKKPAGGSTDKNQLNFRTKVEKDNGKRK